MSKGQSSRKDSKKKPAKTKQEKKLAKREKQQDKLTKGFVFPGREPVL